MISIYSISTLLFAYLLGSIPTAVWIGRAFYGIDVREYGSGNAGASNTFRILGKKAGIPVMLIDILKGWTGANLVYVVGLSITGTPNTIQFANYTLALGITTVLGHIFPVFAGFRGGKGIATLFGMMLAVNPLAALYCVIAFIVVLLLTKYVSLSSMVTGFLYPFLLVFVFRESIKSVLLFSIAVCILVLITHQKNIERLVKGKESKANLFGKKKEKTD